MRGSQATEVTTVNLLSLTITDHVLSRFHFRSGSLSIPENVDCAPWLFVSATSITVVIGTSQLFRSISLY